jgi:phospholipase C
VQGEWSGGATDGFSATAGVDCMGYYTGADPPFSYSLHERFTL